MITLDEVHDLANRWFDTVGERRLSRRSGGILPRSSCADLRACITASRSASRSTTSCTRQWINRDSPVRPFRTLTPLECLARACTGHGTVSIGRHELPGRPAPNVDQGGRSARIGLSNGRLRAI